MENPLMVPRGQGWEGRGLREKICKSASYVHYVALSKVHTYVKSCQIVILQICENVNMSVIPTYSF